jgi:hypothetical protein
MTLRRRLQACGRALMVVLAGASCGAFAASSGFPVLELSSAALAVERPKRAPFCWETAAGCPKIPKRPCIPGEKGCEPGKSGQPQSQNPPAPRRTPASCEKQRKNEAEKCGKLAAAEKEWKKTCVDHYMENKGYCNSAAAGAGLGELKAQCDGARKALEQCQGGKGPAPKPEDPCATAEENTKAACDLAWAFDCACSGANFSNNHDWCSEYLQHQGGGQTADAYSNSQHKVCSDLMNDLKKRKCSGAGSDRSKRPCPPVYKPSRHEMNCWNATSKYFDECLGIEKTAECEQLRAQVQSLCP